MAVKNEEMLMDSSPFFSPAFYLVPFSCTLAPNSYCHMTSIKRENGGRKKRGGKNEQRLIYSSLL